jgi:hypothetical protein
MSMSIIWEGKGTAQEPYRLCSREDLLALQRAVNREYNTFEGSCFLLDRNISLDSGTDSTGESWMPIGTFEHPFDGCLDGGCHVVENVRIEGLYTCYQGFIGCLGHGGYVKNLGVTGKIICRCSSVMLGALVGLSYGRVHNCFAQAVITAENTVEGYIGGIVGFQPRAGEAWIKSCFFAGSVTLSTKATRDGTVEGHYIGGIAGRSRGAVTNCINYGNIVLITDLEMIYAGGITGEGVSILGLNFGILYHGKKKGQMVGSLVGRQDKLIRTDLNKLGYYWNQSVNWGSEKEYARSLEELASVKFCEDLNRMLQSMEDKNPGLPARLIPGGIIYGAYLLPALDIGFREDLHISALSVQKMPECIQRDYEIRVIRVKFKAEEADNHKIQTVNTLEPIPLKNTGQDIKVRFDVPFGSDYSMYDYCQLHAHHKTTGWPRILLLKYC